MYDGKKNVKVVSGDVVGQEIILNFKKKKKKMEYTSSCRYRHFPV